MKKTIAILSICVVALLTSCSEPSTPDVSSGPVFYEDDLEATHDPLTCPECSVTVPEINEEGTVDTEYFTFSYNQATQIVSDYSSSGSVFLSVAPIEGSNIRVDIFGCPMEPIPQDYTAESWKADVAHIIKSYYPEAPSLDISQVGFNLETQTMSAMVRAAATGDIPGSTFQIQMVNGETSNVISILVSENNVTNSEFTEVYSSVKAK